MRVIQAPSNEYIGAGYVGIFLSGGISNCPDWQTELIKKLDGRLDEKYVIVNPRQRNFPSYDRQAKENQAKWELEQMRGCQVVVNWFARETTNPIAMFRLGMEIGRKNAHLFIATHPSFGLRKDLEAQLGHHRPELPLLDSVEALANHIVNTL
jgi:hypothetical protein